MLIRIATVFLALGFLGLPAFAQPPRQWVEFTYRLEPFDTTGRSLRIYAISSDVCMEFPDGTSWCLASFVGVEEYLNGIGQNFSVNRGGVQQPLSFTQDGTPLLRFDADGNFESLGSFSTGGAGWTLLVDSETGSAKAVIRLFDAQVAYGGSVIFFNTYNKFAELAPQILRPGGVACPIDYNGDGENNLFDHLGFLADYDAASINADVTQDGELSDYDITVLLNAVERGCSPLRLPIPGLN